ncbi:MAG: zinc-dependent metalloprotease [Gemmataceae bacterium]
MKRLLSLAIGATLGVSGVMTAQQPAPAPNAAPDIPAAVLAKLGGGGGDDDGPGKKYEDFAKLTKGAKEFDGLFKMYLKDDHLLAEIAPQQFNTSYLAPMAVARGAGSGGTTLDDELIVLQFKRVGDKVHVIRKNTHFRAKKGTPEAAAVETTYADSVLMALPIRSINPMRGAVVVDFNQIFFGDFAQLGIGFLDPNRTTWHKVKAFPRNVELQVAATFAGGRMGRRGGSDAVIDPRGTTVVLHYGLVEMPEPGYTPRLADDRIGYFITAVKDFSGDKPDTNYVRYVNRWRLERADGTPWKEGGKLSPPKKRIVYWIEKSVPDEFRAAVREGILEWNKAFAKVGFRDAIEVRQQENEEFDPEDMNYNTFRWITNEGGYAIGPSRVNPYTGEILDADILFDADMVRFYKREGIIYRPDAREAASTIQAARRGWLLPSADALFGGWDDRDTPAARLRLLQRGLCQCAAHKSSELGFAMTVLAAQFNLKPGDKVPDEMIQQAVKETVMHEVGHTLGLRHNFKASTMLPNDKLHDLAETRKEGLVGSVMDYNPTNLAPKGVKQGDYFTSTVGPYDYWAIEYGYKPDASADDLAKIASRCADPKLIYSTDEDLYGSADPLVNQWDLGNDPMKYAQDRAKMASDLMKDLAERVVEKGEGYQRARQAFGMLLKQYGDAAFLNAKFVGGEMMHRDHKGDPNARDPFVPVTAAKQRAALTFLRDGILTDAPFQFPPELLRKLAAERWMHWGTERTVFGSSVEYPLNERILAIQRVVLDELLDADTLSRIQNVATRTPKGEEPLTLAEVFRTVTEGVWTDLPNGKPDDKKPAASVVRRNLQREHLKDLSGIVLGEKSGQANVVALLMGGAGPTAKVPADAKSLARLHLREIGARIDKVLMASAPPDDTTRAHLEECKERIAKVLAASMTAND